MIDINKIKGGVIKIFIMKLNIKNKMNYFEHLIKNWKVALHSLGDMLIHFIHGLLPFIEIKHYERDNQDK